MAQMPTTPKNDPLRPNHPAPGAPAAPAAPANTSKPNPKLSFDDLDEIPEASQRAALTNPFQDKINHLAKNGGASSVVVPNDDVNWTRDMIRRATGAINKGANTKVAPATENKDGSGAKIPGHTRVYFSVGDKRTRK